MIYSYITVYVVSFTIQNIIQCDANMVWVIGLRFIKQSYFHNLHAGVLKRQKFHTNLSYGVGELKLKLCRLY